MKQVSFSDLSTHKSTTLMTECLFKVIYGKLGNQEENCKKSQRLMRTVLV